MVVSNSFAIVFGERPLEKLPYEKQPTKNLRAARLTNGRYLQKYQLDHLYDLYRWTEHQLTTLNHLAVADWTHQR